MPAPGKLVHTIAVLLKEESTYGTPVALAAATDAFQMFYDGRDFGAPLNIAYAEDGDLGVPVGELGRLKRVTPSGRSATLQLPSLFRGGGAAYSASVLPSIHRLMKAMGFDATLDATGGAEKYTYAATAAGGVGTSLTMEAYARQIPGGNVEKFPLTGAIGTFAIEAQNAKPPRWMFDLSSLINGEIVEAANISPTYPLLTVDPPKAAGMAIGIGSFAANAVVRSWSYRHQREILPRPSLSSADATAGFVPGGRQPMITVTVEASAFVGTPFHASGGIDPYRLHKDAPTLVFTLTVGSVQFNRFKINMPQAQVVEVRPGQDGAVATVELDIIGHQSTPILKDDVNFVTD
jgi:hypothetical protein